MQTKIFRQGDVLLVAVAELPKDAIEQPCAGRIVLAYGEATGHSHAIDATYARMYQWQGDTLVEVTEGAALEHEEHATILLPAGVYRVVRQREYTPGATRMVAD